MLNWFLDFRISGRRPRAGRPIGRAATRRADGGGSNGGDGTAQEEERAAKSGPMLRGPERFFRSGERARARGLDPGHESRPDLHSLLALQLRVGVVARSPARSSRRGQKGEPRRARRKEGRERTLCRETMLRTPPPPRKLFLPPSEFTAGGQESKPRGSRGPQDGGGCCRCNLFEVITLWLDLRLFR